MSFILDRGSRLTYAAQVQRQVEAQVAAGRLHVGDHFPSVRQLSRQLQISRTTAARIHDALAEATITEVRPRSGALVSSRGECTTEIHRARAVRDFVAEIGQRARDLGLDVGQISRLLQVPESEDAQPPVQHLTSFAVLSAREEYECIAACLTKEHPAQLVHVPSTGRTNPSPTGFRYMLTAWHMREQAGQISGELGCSLIHVRYNAALLKKCMSVPADESRVFVTRDAESTQQVAAFLACAFPEVPARRYRVVSAREYLGESASLGRKSQVWAMFTSAPMLRERLGPARLRLFHPLLADDFIQELHWLAMLG